MFYIFNSIFKGPVLFTWFFNNHGFHYCHIMLDFCEMNSVFEGKFRVLLVGKYFEGFLLVANY